MDKHWINNHVYDGKWVRSSLLSYFFLWNEISSQFHLQLKRAERLRVPVIISRGSGISSHNGFCLFIV